MMEAWINNIIEYLKQVAMPILFLLFMTMMMIGKKDYQKSN